MCGIFCLLNPKKSLKTHETDFKRSASRGPDNSCYYKIKDIILGFHRLSINGIDRSSNQPITYNNITIICNGEIYNHSKLFNLISVVPNTRSDCEIIVHMYEKFGIEYTLNMLDGVFAFVLIDNNTQRIYAARDIYGVRPMFHTIGSNTISIASLMKNLLYTKDKIEQFTPGSYSEYIMINGYWRVSVNQKKYHTLNVNNAIQYEDDIFNENIYINTIREYLERAIQKRVDNTDRPIACLLSGGLDSSVVTALVSKYYKNKLETYSIGMEGSEDLKYARIVAEYLGTDHTEIIMTEDEFFKAIPRVVKATETWDTTTIRASVGNFLVAEYISKHSDAKVIFNGDGSDELTGGYLYFNAAPDNISFDHECRRLLKNICYFDVLRSDRTVSCHGLETRTPFLDKDFTAYYLSIPICYRFNKKCEKYILRKSFEYILPKDIIWRKKEAFSDGVSSIEKPWFKTISEKLDSLNFNYIKYNDMLTKEQNYYLYLFDRYFYNCHSAIPYYWMPKFVRALDASARTLNIYNNNI